MKLLTLVLIIASFSIATAQEARLDLANSENRVAELQALVESSFGGGRDYRVGESKFYVVDLQTHSGPLVSETYIFERVRDELKLRIFLPQKPSHARKAEYLNGELIVNGRGQRSSGVGCSYQINRVMSDGNLVQAPICYLSPALHTHRSHQILFDSKQNH